MDWANHWQISPNQTSTLEDLYAQEEQKQHQPKKHPQSSFDYFYIHQGSLAGLARLITNLVGVSYQTRRKRQFLQTFYTFIHGQNVILYLLPVIPLFYMDLFFFQENLFNVSLRTFYFRRLCILFGNMHTYKRSISTYSDTCRAALNAD